MTVQFESSQPKINPTINPNININQNTQNQTNQAFGPNITAGGQAASAPAPAGCGGSLDISA